MKTCEAVVVCALVSGITVAGTFRPPAIPLVTVDPFFSVWSQADTPTATNTTHWSGAVQPLGAQMTVDGKKYCLLGDVQADTARFPSQTVEVRPLQTVCRFKGDTVEAELIFTTPFLPENLDVFSRPVTYVTFRAKADNRKIAFSFSADGRLVTNDDKADAVAEKRDVPGFTAVRLGRAGQKALSGSGDRIRCDWGYAWLAAPDVTASWVVSDGAKPAAGQSAVLGKQFGTTSSCEMHLLLAYDDVQSVMFFGRPLQAWWRRGGKSFEQMIAEAEADYPALMKKVDAFDAEFTADMVRIGGEKYAALGALAFRQSFAACKLVADPNGQPLYFSKENGSGGLIGTLDVLYPQFPHLLLMSPTLARATLAPALLYGSSARWSHPFAPHDLGVWPLANGQAYGDGERGEKNQMPVEESGNMLICLGALSHLEKSADFVSPWWPTVTKWAEFLAAKGFDPENQLCTDDFAGHLAHNANLSVKAITGLACYARMAGLRGDKATAARYSELAKSLVAKWMGAAKDGRGGAYRLAFDQPDSWSMKYNLVWDRILGLGLFPASVAETEMAAYRKVQLPFGLPLDNRKTWTKADWIVWTATLTGKRADFDALVAPLYKFADETPDRIPFTDWYWADSGKFKGFIARSVIGGIYIPFLYDEALWHKYSSRSAATTGSYAPLQEKAK
jgi:hypothetical protein